MEVMWCCREGDLPDHSRRFYRLCDSRLVCDRPGSDALVLAARVISISVLWPKRAIWRCDYETPIKARGEDEIARLPKSEHARSSGFRIYCEVLGVGLFAGEPRRRDRRAYFKRSQDLLAQPAENH